jgi:uncharacterized membrane protein
MNTNLVVLTFSEPTGADDMLRTIKELQSDDFIELLDAVVVTKDMKNKVEVRQPLEVGPGKGAAFGAVTGAVVGLLGGPAGVVVGLVSGAVTGGATAAALAAGVPTAEIKSLALQELEPDESALLVYLEEVWIDQIEQNAKDLAKSIVSHEIAEERKIAREKAAELRKEKIDSAYKSWQAKIDHLRAAVASLRQQAASDVQADRAAVHQQMDSAQAKLDATYQNVLQALQARQQQAEANIHELEASAAHANGQAKAEADQRLAAAREARQALRTHVKETLSARLDSMKADVDALNAKAAKAQGEAKQKLDQRIATLRAQREAQKKRIEQIDLADDAAWDQMVKSIDAAIDTYDAAVRAAETEPEKVA